MKPSFLLSLFVLHAVLATAVNAKGDQRSYDGYRLLSIKLRNEVDGKHVDRLVREHNVDVWSAVRHQEAIVLVSPEKLQSVSALLNNAGMLYETLQSNFGRVIEKERRELVKRALNRRLLGRDLDSVVGTDFFPYKDITRWIESQLTVDNDLSSFTTIGKTAENRDIYVVKIGKSNEANKHQKPIIIVESNIHAREWLSSAATIYVMDRFVRNYGSDSRIRQALDKYEWHFIPIANPDGYEFSWLKDRLWRKNRSTWVNDPSCWGVDINRNFDSHHCKEGTSTDACWIAYCGPQPASENETQAISAYSTALKDRVVAYFSVHTYGQFILLPFGFEQDGPRTDDYDELKRVGDLMSTAMFAVSSKNYTVGNVAEVLYPASGTSLDWAKEKLNIKYVYSAELRPAMEEPGIGFVVSPGHIRPAGKELYEALMTLSENMKQ